MTVVGDRVYALLATPKSAPGRPHRREPQGSRQARSIRSARRSRRSRTARADLSVRRRIGAQALLQLFQPFDADLAGVRHLIFEPDGAMLRLPPNLLIASDAGIDAYRKRARPAATTSSTSPGRSGSAATATLPRRFRRAPSETSFSAPRPPLRAEYLGLGNNAPGSGHGGGATTATARFRSAPGRIRSRRRSCRSPRDTLPAATRCAPRSSPERRSPTMRSRPAPTSTSIA